MRGDEITVLGVYFLFETSLKINILNVLQTTSGLVVCSTQATQQQHSAMAQPQRMCSGTAQPYGCPQKKTRNPPEEGQDVGQRFPTACLRNANAVPATASRGAQTTLETACLKRGGGRERKEQGSKGRQCNQAGMTEAAPQSKPARLGEGGGKVGGPGPQPPPRSPPSTPS